MCNCKNKKNVEPRMNAHFDRGSRNPDIRAPKINALSDEALAALKAQALASMPPSVESAGGLDPNSSTASGS